MSKRWNILIESIPDNDNSRNESQKLMSIPNRTVYQDNQRSANIYPVENRPVLQSFNRSPSPYSYRQAPDPVDNRQIKIVRYVPLSKGPSTDDKSSQTLDDLDLERQQSMVIQSSGARNVSSSNNYFSDSRNLRRYKSANSFSSSEWREPVKPITTITPRQSSISLAPPARKEREIISINDDDDSMNKNKDLYEPEVCIKKKLSHGAKHLIYITHGRDSP